MIPEIAHYTQRLSIPSSVKETASEDGAVLLDVEQGVCFSLNSSGLRIWTLLRQGNNIEQIADALQSDYSVLRPQLLDDLCGFMSELESRKLLLVGDSKTLSSKKDGFWSRVWKPRNSA
ncbi:MAG: PqqD family protein [Actinomycetota bacterium]